MTDKALSAVKAYFNYQRCKVGNGYASESMTAKLGNNSTGGGNFGSSVPKGVRMTDAGFLEFINRISLALDALKVSNERAYNYLCLRYDHGLKHKEIPGLMQCSPATCDRLHSLAIVIIKNNI